MIDQRAVASSKENIWIPSLVPISLGRFLEPWIAQRSVGDRKEHLVVIRIYLMLKQN